MKKLYLDQLETLESHGREIRVTHCLAIQRSVLQTAALSALEYILDVDSEFVDSQTAEEILQPADGTPISVLDGLLPAIRCSGWSSCAIGWYEATPDSDTGELREPLVRELVRWVGFRNERFGHGVVDEATWQSANEWFPPLTRILICVLEPLLPAVSDDGKLVLYAPNREVKLQTLRLIDGAPLVIRRIKKRGSTWRLEYQRLNLDLASTGSYDLTQNLLLTHIEAGASLYSPRSVVVGPSDTWRPLVSLPARQTNEFYGRGNELKQLEQWFLDTDSRACLVYGEGGIGKTTLALEFLNSLLDSPSQRLTWRPDVIAFYSAKQTRWGAKGLEYIRGISPMISESARLLARVVEDRLGKDWYDEDPKKTIDRAAQLLNDVGVGRDKVLLILDNTETLSRSQSDERGLGDLIRHLSKRLCRVLLTSRRRERVEAAPIQLLPMSEEEGATLLRRLGSVYGAEPIKMAGEATLRRFSGKLSGRPLLIDVFARQASSRGSSLEGALQAVLQTAGADLGRFLFEDAWQRISAPERDVFAILAGMPDPIDSQVVGWICAEVGIAHEVWFEAFEETRFGHIQDYGTRYDLELMPDTRMFLATKSQQLAVDDRARLDRCLNKVRSRSDQYFKAHESGVHDRVREAFRTAAAKAAKIAGCAGRLDDARLWYEEAIRVDANNAALWDRFAWFMMIRMRDLSMADRLAKEACKIDPTSADAFFTRGMVAARLGKLGDADRWLDEAAKLGKPKHLVSLQKARARITALQSGASDGEKLIGEVEHLITAAELRQSRDYWQKHIEECGRIRRQLKEIRRRLLRKKKVVVEHKQLRQPKK
jgi:tetratricopeptide (TPR) repeat protein